MRCRGQGHKPRLTRDLPQLATTWPIVALLAATEDESLDWRDGQRVRSGGCRSQSRALRSREGRLALNPYSVSMGAAYLAPSVEAKRLKRMTPWSGLRAEMRAGRKEKQPSDPLQREA
jgi:hypothetical protein